MMKIFPKPRNLELISIYVWMGTLIRGREFVLDFRLYFWINPKSTQSHSGVLTLSSESTQNLPKINPIAFWSFDFSFRINPIAFWSFDFILRINPFAFWSIKKSKSTQNQLETHPKSQNQLKSSFWSTKKSKNNPKSTRNQPKINPNFELQSRTGANHLFERSTQNQPKFISISSDIRFEMVLARKTTKHMFFTFYRSLNYNLFENSEQILDPALIKVILRESVVGDAIRGDFERK